MGGETKMTIDQALGRIGACSPSIVTGSEGEMERIHKFDEAMDFITDKLKNQEPELVDTNFWLLLDEAKFAACEDYVIVELKLRKNRSVLAPASIVLAQNGGYEIQMIGNTIIMSEESYGKAWRCWVMQEPSAEERANYKWE